MVAAEVEAALVVSGCTGGGGLTYSALKCKPPPCPPNKHPTLTKMPLTVNGSAFRANILHKVGNAMYTCTSRQLSKVEKLHWVHSQYGRCEEREQSIRHVPCPLGHCILTAVHRVDSKPWPLARWDSWAGLGVLQASGIWFRLHEKT